MGITISKAAILDLPLESFEGKIEIIDSAKKVLRAIEYLSTQSQLGFDTETKPAFKKGQYNKVALMQLSTEDMCFLFRLNMIGYPKELDKIICNKDIIKIGLSLQDDFAAIGKRSKRKPQNFVDLQKMVVDYNIDEKSLKSIYAILFRKRISKGQRLSNWESTILTDAQQNYAALDAWACLKIYNHLISHG